MKGAVGVDLIAPGGWGITGVRWKATAHVDAIARSDGHRMVCQTLRFAGADDWHQAIEVPLVTCTYDTDDNARPGWPPDGREFIGGPFPWIGVADQHGRASLGLGTIRGKNRTGAFPRQALSTGGFGGAFNRLVAFGQRPLNESEVEYSVERIQYRRLTQPGRIYGWRMEQVSEWHWGWTPYLPVGGYWEWRVQLKWCGVLYRLPVWVGDWGEFLDGCAPLQLVTDGFDRPGTWTMRYTDSEVRFLVEGWQPVTSIAVRQNDGRGQYGFRRDLSRGFTLGAGPGAYPSAGERVSLTA